MGKVCGVFVFLILASLTSFTEVTRMLYFNQKLCFILFQNRMNFLKPFSYKESPVLFHRRLNYVLGELSL